MLAYYEDMQIKALMSSSFGQFPLMATELATLEHLKYSMSLFSISIDPNLLNFR